MFWCIKSTSTGKTVSLMSTRPCTGQALDRCRNTRKPPYGFDEIPTIQFQQPIDERSWYGLRKKILDLLFRHLEKYNIIPENNELSQLKTRPNRLKNKRRFQVLVNGKMSGNFHTWWQNPFSSCKCSHQPSRSLSSKVSCETTLMPTNDSIFWMCVLCLLICKLSTGPFKR